MAKSLAFAQPIKIVAVPSLEAQALNLELAAREQHLDIQNLAVVLEAGRRQIFAAVFQKVTETHSANKFLPGLRTLTGQSVLSCADLLARAPRPLYILGEGVNYHRSELTADEVYILDEKYFEYLPGFLIFNFSPSYAIFNSLLIILILK